MPKGFRTESGPMPEWAVKYGLVEDNSSSYVPRTRKNARDSDATIWFGKTGSPGYYCTLKACKDWHKPFLVNPPSMKYVADTYEIVNIAGNRASINPDVIMLVRRSFEALKPRITEERSNETE